jgi:hypothetical protein
MDIPKLLNITGAEFVTLDKVLKEPIHRLFESFFSNISEFTVLLLFFKVFYAAKSETQKSFVLKISDCVSEESGLSKTFL